MVMVMGILSCMLVFMGIGYAALSQVLKVTTTGNVTGPHLHFEIRHSTSISNFFGNNWLNPLDYLPGGYTILD